MPIPLVRNFIDPVSQASQLSALEKEIPNISSLPIHPLTFFSNFHKTAQQVEEGKRFGRAVRDMASYLALSKGDGQIVAKIREVGKILARTKISFSAEDKALLERVRLAALLREHPEQIDAIKRNINRYFATGLNRQLFAKWKKQGFAEEAFLFNPTVPSFIFKTHLNHTVTQFGDTFQYDEAAHEFKMLVDRVYQNVAEVIENVSIKEEKRLGSVIVSLVNKENEREKKYYLPKKGLTTWDNEGWKKLQPFAHLTPAQVQFTQQSARKKDGSAGGPGDYVVEFVSTMNDYKERPLISGYQETFKKYSHALLRIITPDGKLYSFGFNVGQDIPAGQPATFVRGIFRNPDSWETKPFKERLLSGFAVDKATFTKIIKEVETYQSKKTPFNIIEKNCTAFIQRIKDIVAPDKGKNLSFAADITEVFRRCLPKTIQHIGKKLSPVWSNIKFLFGQFCAPLPIKIAKMVTAFFRLLLERTVIAFSGRWFAYGEGKSFPHTKDPHAGIPWKRIITHINIALEQRLVRTYLPKKLAEWQLSLPQTRIVGKDTSLFGQYEPCSFMA